VGLRKRKDLLKYFPCRVVQSFKMGSILACETILNHWVGGDVVVQVKDSACRKESLIIHRQIIDIGRLMGRGKDEK